MSKKKEQTVELLDMEKETAPLWSLIWGLEMHGDDLKSQTIQWFVSMLKDTLRDFEYKHSVTTKQDGDEYV